VKKVLGTILAVFFWLFLSSAAAAENLEGAIADLGSEDPDKRRTASELLIAAGSGDADLRWAAVWALVRIGPPSVSDLVSSFETQSSEANAGAEIALAKIGKPAVPQLISALNNKNPRVRRHSARLLGRIGDPSSAPALKKSLQDQNEDVRNEASIALTKITEE
jgi:HEAT repeat protein